MRALVKKKPTNPPQWYEGLELKDKPEPQVSAERPVKLNIISAGICGTDVGIYQGKDALANAMAKLSTDEVITGHEFCGRVAELHPSARIFIAQLLLRRRNTTPDVMAYCQGKTVDELARDENFEAFLNKHFYASAEMHFTCGRCLQCRTGHEHVCKKTIGKGMHEDGAFTEYMVIPANRLVLFEDGEISPDIISFMDALGNAVHTAQSADLVGKNILITGGLYDPRVQYWEPAKWVAKLRTIKTDDHLLLLQVNMGAGHHGSLGRYDSLEQEAFEYAFLLQAVGSAE